LVMTVNLSGANKSNVENFLLLTSAFENSSTYDASTASVDTIDLGGKLIHA
jgi:hypothetical protein